MKRILSAIFLISTLTACDNSPGPVPVADITVVPGSTSLLVGNSATLTATTTDAAGNVLTGRPVTWTSSNPAAATVTSAGVVTAISPTTSVNITATSGGKIGTALVTVLAPVASVTVTPSSATIPLGGTTTLTATARDAIGNSLLGRTVTWVSSNPTVATVSQPTGTTVLITGVAPGGPVSITASSEGRSAAAQITVPAPVATLSGTVTDQFGGAVPSATIELLQGATVTATLTTSSTGQFTRTNVPGGSYSVRASKAGFVSSSTPVTIAPPTTSVNVRLAPQSLPSAGTVATRVISTATQQYTFEADIFVVDANSQSIPLTASAFSIEPFTFSGTQFNFAQDAAVSFTPPANGPFSVAMLLDQSGSITSTDPNDSRIQAAKIFLNALGPGDNVVLSAFAGSGRLIPFELTVYGNGFTTNGPSYFSTLDQLARQVGGGTPLYKSTRSMIDYASTNALTPNKAVLVFTDGDDTDGGATIADVAARAAATGVRVYTVGLGSVNTSVLSEMASRGGGTMMWASDARQLVSLYGTVGRLLRGAVSLYRTRWTMRVSSGNWASVSSAIRVQTPNGPLSVPFWVRFSGSGPIVAELGGAAISPAMVKARPVSGTQR